LVPVSTGAKILVRPLPRPQASRVLVCIGYSGGGTAPFRRWVQQLPDSTELVLVCYPGREGRFTEPYATQWEPLCEEVVDAVVPGPELAVLDVADEPLSEDRITVREAPGLTTVLLRVRGVPSVVVVDERGLPDDSLRFRFASGAHPWQLAPKESYMMLNAVAKALP